MALNIVLFNVKFSPNLGDGAIAECLESALREHIPEASVRSLDLAGRREWSASDNGGTRVLYLNLLDRMPRWCRDIAVICAVSRTMLRTLPTWRSELSSADVVIFGGGQLLQDGDLNFPLKLALAAHQCRQQRLPCAIFGIGATKPSSRIGSRLLSVLTKYPNLVHAAARDENSTAILSQLGCDAVLCRDPALVAKLVWPVSRPQCRQRTLVGVCITHPSVLRHHSDRSLAANERRILRLYAELVRKVSAEGYDVLCFTNGAWEDEVALSKVASQISQAPEHHGNISFAPRCARPNALAHLLAGLDLVIAHRLHATILAFSYGIPAIGLLWDPKLAAFFHSVGRSRHLAPLDDEFVTTIQRRLQIALNDDVSGVECGRIIEEAHRAIGRLAKDIVEGVPAKADPLRVQSSSMNPEPPSALGQRVAGHHQ